MTLKTDRVGNQLAPPADVKLRGMIVGEVRVGHLRRPQGHHRPRAAAADGRPHPGQRVRAAAAQDAVRREVRRPGPAGRGPRSSGSSEGDVITQDRIVDRHRARAGARRPAAAAAHHPAGQAQRHPQRARHRARGPGRAARREPRAGRRLLHPSSTRSCPRSRRTSPGSPTSRRSTPTPPPTWCGCCATSRSRPAPSGPSPTPTPGSSPAPPASRRRPAGCSRRTRTGSSSWPRSAGPSSTCSRSTRPSTPACSRA